MPDHNIAAPNDWLAARKQLLITEKEYSRP